jgi:TetR/AcrR family transcriptional regulator, transcriptional repressor for nem operon
LARVRPERSLLEGVVSTALISLEPRDRMTGQA